MNLQAGLFLYSTSALDDTYFADAIVYLTECNAGGALGFVVNRPFGRSLHELKEFKHSRSFPLFEGGPVDQEHLFFLHCRPDLITDGTLVSGKVFSGGNFRQVVNGINNRSLLVQDVKLFIGYCGWDAGELEAEIAEGSWELRAGQDDTIFRTAL
jgi:putative transcriptional regulator